MKSISSVVWASLLICLFALCSCRNKQNNTIILQQIDEGLVQSNRQIRMSTDEILEALKNKVDDPKTAEKAKIMQPKAALIRTYTDTIIVYIEKLKRTLTNENSVNESMIAELSRRFTGYKQAIISSDERIANSKNDILTGFINGGKDSVNGSKTELKKILTDASPAERSTYLSRMQNDVAIIEHKTINFLLQQIGAYTDGFEMFEAIVGQNAKILEAGDYLEISAGVGALSIRAEPIITVGKDSVKINERGLAVYKFKTSNVPGHHSVPVVIKFKDEDGKDQTHSFTVEYKTVSSRLK